MHFWLFPFTVARENFPFSKLRYRKTNNIYYFYYVFLRIITMVILFSFISAIKMPSFEYKHYNLRSLVRHSYRRYFKNISKVYIDYNSSFSLYIAVTLYFDCNSLQWIFFSNSIIIKVSNIKCKKKHSSLICKIKLKLPLKRTINNIKRKKRETHFNGLHKINTSNNKMYHA